MTCGSFLLACVRTVMRGYEYDYESETEKMT